MLTIKSSENERFCFNKKPKFAPQNSKKIKINQSTINNRNTPSVFSVSKLNDD
ncbi:MAG: hypothetical protein JNL70_00745 [Saprospiraceae bacterium]|nr:hypothetical protein [Saprospiraceae bacterium]